MIQDWIVDQLVPKCEKYGIFNKMFKKIDGNKTERFIASMNQVIFAVLDNLLFQS